MSNFCIIISIFFSRNASCFTIFTSVNNLTSLAFFNNLCSISFINFIRSFLFSFSLFSQLSILCSIISFFWLINVKPLFTCSVNFFTKFFNSSLALPLPYIASDICLSIYLDTLWVRSEHSRDIFCISALVWLVISSISFFNISKEFSNLLFIFCEKIFPSISALYLASTSDFTVFVIFSVSFPIKYFCDSKSFCLWSIFSLLPLTISSWSIFIFKFKSFEFALFCSEILLITFSALYLFSFSSKLLTCICFNWIWKFLSLVFILSINIWLACSKLDNFASKSFIFESII